MEEISIWKSARWMVLSIVAFIGGCAPGPPPPVPPGLFSNLFSWFLLALLVWICVLLWRNSTKGQDNNKADHLTDAMNQINERLTVLEEKIEQMKNSEKH